MSKEKRKKYQMRPEIRLPWEMKLEYENFPVLRIAYLYKTYRL